jgi:hypothetical protein
MTSNAPLRRAAAAAALAVAALLGAAPLGGGAAAADLLMFEAPGCAWCARWNREIGVSYALTEEGRRAPLIRRDIAQGAPEGVRLKTPAAFTPTFVLIDAGREIGRIEGHPGEDFFWPMLGMLLDRLPPQSPDAQSPGAQTPDAQRPDAARAAPEPAGSKG